MILSALGLNPHGFKTRHVGEVSNPLYRGLRSPHLPMWDTQSNNSKLLEDLLTTEEIKEALLSCDPSKAQATMSSISKVLERSGQLLEKSSANTLRISLKLRTSIRA